MSPKQTLSLMREHSEADKRHAPRTIPPFQTISAENTAPTIAYGATTFFTDNTAAGRDTTLRTASTIVKSKL